MIDQMLLKSYIRVALKTRMKSEKYNKKIKSKDIKQYIVNLSNQLYEVLKQNKCLFMTYKLFTNEELKQKYKIKLNKKQIKQFNSIVKKIKNISDGVLLRNPSHIVHNILVVKL